MANLVAREEISHLILRNDTNEILQRLNDAKAFLYIPVIVFLIILVVVGTFGNILVCCVYWSKPYKASSHYFILSLAILDLFSCVIGIPTEIADLRYPYMFYAPAACKLLRFVHSSTIIASSCILIEVAFDRYFRICKLGRQYSVQKAKMLCILAISLGILTSWPSCLLFGRETIHFGIPGVEGIDCSTADWAKGTMYPTLYYGFLFTLFFITVTFFVVLYSRIGIVIWRRKKTTIGAKIAVSKSGINSQVSDPTSTEVSSEVDEHGSHKDQHTKEAMPALGKDTLKQRQKMRVGKTTTVLFAVTLAYILSFLPFLIVMVLRSIIKDFEGRLSPTGEVAYKFCVKSFFINNAINPVIYSFLNASFRRDAKHLLRKVVRTCCCCRCCRTEDSWEHSDAV
ncbi:orexin receptor type 2-like [Haliotis rubra]|uniref:orexin receptor type 2-like n=1 Tax=Haliotis rubra TaxID=36100 RepID=UPI001EE5F81B|nr:orexin receptor type 2-like [Haliotis rubra]XP_046550677.1 orexin receptor type 2-like [Haliotis rubra]